MQDHVMCQKLNNEVLQKKKELHQQGLNVLIIQADCYNGQQHYYS